MNVIIEPMASVILVTRRLVLEKGSKTAKGLYDVKTNDIFDESIFFMPIMHYYTGILVFEFILQFMKLKIQYKL